MAPICAATSIWVRDRLWRTSANFADRIKVGNAYSYDIASKKLKGMGEQSVMWPHFWNVSF